MLINSKTMKPWLGEALDDVGHPLDIEMLWSAEALAKIGLYSPQPFTPPPGKVAVGEPTYVLDAYGNVVTHYEVTDAPPPEPAEVDAERDKRIAAGFHYQDVFYQTDPDARENIAGASTAALGALMTGAKPGDFRWHGGADDFEWIAADNSEHPMDALTMFNFGQAAMAHKQAHIFAARKLKDMKPTPSDFTADKYWPVS